MTLPLISWRSTIIITTIYYTFLVLVYLTSCMNEWQFVFQIKYYYLLKFKYTRFTDLRLEAGMLIVQNGPKISCINTRKFVNNNGECSVLRSMTKNTCFYTIFFTIFTDYSFILITPYTYNNNNKQNLDWREMISRHVSPSLASVDKYGREASNFKGIY